MGEQVAALIWGCSSVGRAPALQAGGHEFESHHLHEGNEPCQTGKHCKLVLARKLTRISGLIGRKPVMKKAEGL